MVLTLLACADRDPTTVPDAGQDGAPLAVVVNEVAPATARSRGGRDWIELYAASDEDVALAGWTLTVGDGAPHALSGTLAARSFLVLEGDGEVDGDGDVLVLRAPDGAAARVEVGNTWTDVVWARGADGGDVWGPTWLGTPGATNGVAGPRATDLDWAEPNAGSAFFEADAAAVTALDLAITTADGVEVFVDGEPVLRDGLPSGAITPDTPPLGPRDPATTLVRIGPEALLPGATHVLAVRLHPAGPSKGPFALSLDAKGPPSPPAGPRPAGDEHTGALPAAGDDVFSPDRIHEVALALGPAAVAALDVDTHTYVPGVLTFDGAVVDGVTVRRRGKGGSRRPMGGKPKLRVDLTPDGGGGAFHGVGALLLDNLVQDCSGVKMPAAFEVFRLTGNAAPRTGWAHLVIDGADYGLYALTEEIDDRFAERWFDDADAVLHDGSYVNEPGEPLSLVDFTWDTLPAWDQEGGPVDNTVLADVTAALDAWEQGARTWAELDDVIDRGTWLRHFAAEQWAGHVDGYVLMPNNEWLVTPDDGRTRVVAWDTDQAFLHDTDWFTGTRWTEPGGRLARLCRRDPACDAEWEATLDAVSLRVDTSDLGALVDRLDALTRDAALADPRRECPADAVVPARDAVRAWLAGRTAALEAGDG